MSTATPGTQLWAARFARFTAPGTGIAASPDGSKAFVSGPGGLVAYNPATGQRIRRSSSASWGVTVGPDSSKVYVLGGLGSGSGGSAGPASFDASTGARLWTAPLRFAGDDYHDWGWAKGMSLSPDGSRLFVAGEYQNFDACAGPGFALAAYEGDDGSVALVGRRVLLGRPVRMVRRAVGHRHRAGRCPGLRDGMTTDWATGNTTTSRSPTTRRSGPRCGRGSTTGPRRGEMSPRRSR